MAAYKPRAYYPPQPEQFTHQRLIANLSIKDVAAMLHVSQKTVKNWESGKTQIPYSAFKLLKVLTNYDMPDARWEGWCLRDGALWSPANRSFEPHELVYIANMFAYGAALCRRAQGSPDVPAPCPACGRVYCCSRLRYKILPNKQFSPVAKTNSWQ